MRLLPVLDSCSRPSKPLSSLELPWISVSTTSYSSTTRSMKIHLVLITLDTLDSFDAPIKDLLKIFGENKNQIILSSMRVLSNYNQHHHNKVMMEKSLWNLFWTAGVGQTMALFPQKQIFCRVSTSWLANTARERVWEATLQLHSEQEGNLLLEIFYCLSQSPFIYILYRDWLVFN